MKRKFLSIVGSIDERIREIIPKQLYSLFATLYWYSEPTSVKKSRIKSKQDKYTLRPMVTIEEGDIVVDCGAFTGRFTMLAAQKAKKVFAFEPDPKNFILLKTACRNLTNVKLFNLALWDQRGMFRLKRSSKGFESSLINIDHGELIGKYMVKTERFDIWAKKRGIDKIDFLKVEAEGGEPEVIKGARGILSEVNKVAVDCGAERKGKTTSLQVEKILESSGFKNKTRNNIIYGWRV